MGRDRRTGGTVDCNLSSKLRRNIHERGCLAALARLGRWVCPVPPVRHLETLDHRAHRPHGHAAGCDAGRRAGGPVRRSRVDCPGRPVTWSSDVNTAEQIIEKATQTGLTVTTAESCTGGKVAAALTDVAGSSAVFERGFVTYSNAAKAEMLGVLTATLDAHGAVSEDVVREMALGARAAARADVAVAISGIAGPGGSEFKPEGRVCYGLASAAGVITETVEHGAIGRAEVRAAATKHALDLILSAL
ncbi:CinA family protein [Mameliella sp. CS4]|nr:CinA family protein [Mameliella sp. CS4]